MQYSLIDLFFSFNLTPAELHDSKNNKNSDFEAV